MLDASLAFMTSALTPFLLTGEELPRMGNTGYSGLPTSALFTAKDGREISLGVVLPKQFEALASYLGREDWLHDPRYSTPEAQRANFAALHEELAIALRTRDAAQLELEMSERGIPCGMVRRVGEATELVGNGGLQQLALRSLREDGRGEIPSAGFNMVPDGPLVSEPPPRLDEHREEILAWLAEPVAQ
jgi:CoA:oxalate CoA-transferase